MFSRYKVRQVVRSFSQREGLDFDETYAIVVKLVSLRVLFAMIAEDDLKCYQYDLIAAFLNALIGTYTILVEQLYGFETGNNKVCILQKVLYRLKQAPLLQYDEFAKFAKVYGFDLFLADVYVFRNRDTRVIIVIYVNDVLLITKLLDSILGTAKLIGGVFPIRPLSKLHYYLGMRIVRNRERRQLIVVQDVYIEKIAAKFNLTGLYLVETSALLGKTLALQLKAVLEDYVVPNKLKVKYQQLVGSRVQPVYISRPDYSSIATRSGFSIASYETLLHFIATLYYMYLVIQQLPRIVGCCSKVVKLTCQQVTPIYYRLIILIHAD